MAESISLLLWDLLIYKLMYDAYELDKKAIFSQYFIAMQSNGRIDRNNVRE